MDYNVYVQSYHMTINWMLFLNYGVIMKINGSSAIANVNFDLDENQIGVTYTSQDKEYVFLAKDKNRVRTELASTTARNESVGRLINDYKKSGQLTEV